MKAEILKFTWHDKNKQIKIYEIYNNDFRLLVYPAII